MLLMGIMKLSWGISYLSSINMLLNCFPLHFTYFFFS